MRVDEGKRERVCGQGVRGEWKDLNAAYARLASE